MWELIKSLMALVLGLHQEWNCTASDSKVLCSVSHHTSKHYSTGHCVPNFCRGQARLVCQRCRWRVAARRSIWNFVHFHQEHLKLEHMWSNQIIFLYTKKKHMVWTIRLIWGFVVTRKIVQYLKKCAKKCKTRLATLLTGGLYICFYILIIYICLFSTLHAEANAMTTTNQIDKKNNLPCRIWSNVKFLLVTYTTKLVEPLVVAPVTKCGNHVNFCCWIFFSQKLYARAAIARSVNQASLTVTANQRMRTASIDIWQPVRTPSQSHQYLKWLILPLAYWIGSSQYRRSVIIL